MSTFKLPISTKLEHEEGLTFWWVFVQCTET